MPSLLYSVVATVMLSVACAQSPKTTAHQELKHFVRQVAQRALDFTEGKIASLPDAQNDFTSDGWKLLCTELLNQRRTK